MQNYLVKDLFHYCNVALKNCPAIYEHKIKWYDLSFVLEGSMTYYADGQKITLEKNDAMFLKPGTMRIRKEGAAPLRFVSFNFSTFDDVDLPFPVYMPKCITKEIRNLIQLYPPTHLSAFYHSKEKCMCVLNYILHGLLDLSEMNCENEHIKKILYYIEEHITENVTLQVISAQMNLSKEYTSHIFKKEIGKTLTDYVNNRKLLLAKEMIVDTEMSLTDIAEYLGFNNYNYFSRLFKKYLEITPIALKQKGR